MKHTRTWMATLLLGTLLALPAVTPAQVKAEVALRAAMETETVKGDLKSAIEQYKKIAQGGDRALAAKALVRMGECYQKLGDAESRTVYERVVREFADQAESAATARTRLAALTRPGGTAVASGVVLRSIWTGPDVDTEGSPSPDGRYLPFVDVSNDTVHVRDLATGLNRQLTISGHPFHNQDEYAEGAIVSPDNKYIFYAWFTRGADELRMIPIEGELGGAKPRVLFRDENEKDVYANAVTPDGKQILATLGGSFASDDDQKIALISVADGSVQVLKLQAQYDDNQRMSISPDGRYIVYATEGNISILSIDGRRETVIHHPAREWGPFWTPDGKRVLFLSDRTGSDSLWIIDVVDGRPQGSPELVKTDLGPITPMGLTRDGSYYYYVGLQPQNIYTAEMDPETGKVTAPERTAESYVGRNLGPVWSPDGQQLAYLSLRSSLHSGPGERTLMIRSVKTGAERVLSSKLWMPHRGPVVRWFPDGRSLLVPGWSQTDTRWSFYRIDAQTGEVGLIQESLNRDWSRPPVPALPPDGKAIYYLYDDPSSKGSLIVVHEIETGRDTEVYRVPSRRELATFTLSRDGRQLAVLGTDNATGLQTLKIMQTAGGTPVEVFRASHPNDIVEQDGIELTSDGRHVLVVRNADAKSGTQGGLWRVPTDRGEPQELMAMEGLRVPIPNIHPDGRRIAFTAGDRGRREVWVMQNFLPPLKAVR